MHFVYILTSLDNPQQCYIGLTKDINQRLKEHNAGQHDAYSKRYVPWKLETYLGFSDKQLAINFERYLKSGSGHAFLKKRLLP